MPEFNHETAVWFFAGVMAMWAVMMIIARKVGQKADFIIASLEEENDELRACVNDLQSRTCERCGSAHCRRDARRSGMKRGQLFGNRRTSSASRRQPAAHKARWSY
jgi:hypothetical protein